MTKSIRLHDKLSFGDSKAAREAFEVINDVLSKDQRDIIQELYFLGPIRLYNHSVNAFGKLEAFGLVRMEGRVSFLTTAGNVFAILGGLHEKKLAWIREKELVRQREIKEVYAILGRLPSKDDGDEPDDVPSFRG